jgi:transglutaminase-like putative cysteine protease
VLRYREGVCFAKSHLFAAILRYLGIPVGLCYQRLTKGNTPDTGYVLHGLNAVYLLDENRWVRLDARGNNAQVHTPFSLSEEKIAWPVRRDLGEIDYPIIYSAPPLRIIQAFEAYHNRKYDEFGITEL